VVFIHFPHRARQSEWKIKDYLMCAVIKATMSIKGFFFSRLWSTDWKHSVFFMIRAVFLFVFVLVRLFCFFFFIMRLSVLSSLYSNLIVARDNEYTGDVEWKTYPLYKPMNKGEQWRKNVSVGKPSCVYLPYHVFRVLT
jgi:hypothetical protein